MTVSSSILGAVPNSTPPNRVPRSTYELPAGDRDLSRDVQEWLRVHPLAYVFPAGDRYLRCPTCEEWTPGRGGCDVRRLVNGGRLIEARELHEKREWPMGTGNNGGVAHRLRGMKPNYCLVTFVHLESGATREPITRVSGAKQGRTARGGAQ